MTQAAMPARVADGESPPRLSRADLANFLLEQLGGTRWSKRTPTLTY